MRRWWICLLVPLTLVWLAVGCSRPVPLSEAELIAQHREQAERHLAARYAGMPIDLLEPSQVNAQKATFVASTELLGRKCGFQVDVRLGADSDDLGERAAELFAHRVWNELHDRHQSVARSESCFVRSADELEFSLCSEFPRFGLTVPFTLTLTADGSTDNLLEQLQPQATDLAKRHLQATYPPAYQAETVGSPNLIGNRLSVAARALFLGEDIDFQVEVHPSGVGDDLCQVISRASWCSRATVWGYDSSFGCPNSEAIPGGRKLSFTRLQDGWVSVFAAGGEGGGLLPLWYLTRNKAELIASHAPVVRIMAKGVRLYATPEAGGEVVASSSAPQLVQVSAEHGGFSYGRCQPGADHAPVAGWILTSELHPLSDQSLSAVSGLISAVAGQAEVYLQRYSLFQPRTMGQPYLDRGLVRVNCRLNAFGREIGFRLAYDGLYSDDLAGGLKQLTVYPRLALHPAQNSSRVFVVGEALQVQGLAKGEQIGAWPGGDLPWVLVERDQSSGWLPLAYLSLVPTDHYPELRPYEMIAARDADVLFFPGSGDRVQPLTVGRVVQVSSQSEGYLYVRYSPGEATPWAGGWVSRTDLQAFDERVSRECLLAKGAVMFESEPNNPDAQWVNDMLRSAHILKEENGWVLVSAPGGLVGWTEQQNLISRNPWRLP